MPRYDVAMTRLSKDTVRHKIRNKYEVQNLPTSVRLRLSERPLLLIFDEFIGHLIRAKCIGTAVQQSPCTIGWC